jgi:hypothetical protein
LAGVEGDDRDLNIGNIGEGFDGEVAEGGDADAKEKQQNQEDEQRLVDGEENELPHGGAYRAPLR